MSQEIKFTSDGKKVVVIGSLNSQEKIVQEIFVADGSEIPSGEHFVVKSLHDTPAVSWKEKNLKELEARCERDKKKYDSEINSLHKNYVAKTSELRRKLEYIGAVLKNADINAFNTLVDYMTGEIKWVVVDMYDPELLPISKFEEMYDGELRLISIFGRDNGTFTYARGYYSDHSGGVRYFYPFKNHEDALSKLAEIILSKDITTASLAIAKKHNIAIPKDKIDAYKEKEIASLDSYIERTIRDLDKLKSRKDELLTE